MLERVNTKFSPASENSDFSRSINWNLTAPQLYEHALIRKEAKLTSEGALCADTGSHTGRSPKDKFIVCDSLTQDRIWWDNSKKMTDEKFDLLFEDFANYMKDKEIFGQELFASANPKHRASVQVFTEYAWHSLFIRNLLIRPDSESLSNFEPNLTIICMPGFKANPEKHGCRSETVIAVNFSRKIILIGGTEYAGEMKKSVFSYFNFTLPNKNVMPMHCSANIGNDGDSAVFFGLSGTGKTTLSTDPNRLLIGDDEHGWGEEGIFNFEGGCYAKTINLSEKSEPEIYATTQRFGTILENVVLNDSQQPDFDDGSKTENARCAYPIHFIDNASESGCGTHPKNIIMLTADAFGVLPPIAKLSLDQAIYYFLSGYTAKLAGTERGVTEPEATFSACFGAPFMPCHPTVYGNLLKDLISKHGTDCWLVNTGWTGGAYGTGQRMPIKVTRTLLNAALNGTLSKNQFRTENHFGLSIPTTVPGVEEEILDPRRTWADPNAYDQQAAKLLELFEKNFKKFETTNDADSELANSDTLLAAA